MSYILFARWFGLTSVLLSLGILFHLRDARKMARKMMESESGFIMGGVLPIIFGSLAFTQHHHFRADWELVVTLVGVFMLAIGCFRVLFVHHWKSLIRRNIDKIPTLFSLFGLMLGLLLLYVGYIAPLVSYRPLIVY